MASYSFFIKTPHLILAYLSSNHLHFEAFNLTTGKCIKRLSERLRGEFHSALGPTSDFEWLMVKDGPRVIRINTVTFAVASFDISKIKPTCYIAQMSAISQSRVFLKPSDNTDPVLIDLVDGGPSCLVWSGPLPAGASLYHCAKGSLFMASSVYSHGASGMYRFDLKTHAFTTTSSSTFQIWPFSWTPDHLILIENTETSLLVPGDSTPLVKLPHNGTIAKGWAPPVKLDAAIDNTMHITSLLNPLAPLLLASFRFPSGALRALAPGAQSFDVIATLSGDSVSVYRLSDQLASSRATTASARTQVSGSSVASSSSN